MRNCLPSISNMRRLEPRLSSGRFLPSTSRRSDGTTSRSGRTPNLPRCYTCWSIGRRHANISPHRSDWRLLFGRSALLSGRWSSYSVVCAHGVSGCQLSRRGAACGLIRQFRGVALIAEAASVRSPLTARTRCDNYSSPLLRGFEHPFRPAPLHSGYLGRLSAVSATVLIEQKT